MAIDAMVEIDGQYRELREGAGFLRRDRVALEFKGPDAAELLQGQLTNDVEALAPGAGCYAALLDRKGHMQADMRVLRLGPDEFALGIEASGADAVVAHFNLYRVGSDVEISQPALVVFSAIGPGAFNAAGAPPLPTEHDHAETQVGGVRVHAVATDLGVDLVVPSEHAESVAEALNAGGGAEVAEEAAEIVRAESGRPRFGVDMDVGVMPAEAGIVERAVSFTKGCYIGQETVARLHYKGKPNRHLRGLRLDSPAATGEPVMVGDREVGAVGTAVLSPALGPIALAILRREAEPGARVTVGATRLGAEVTELPFDTQT
jgi:folate-binding protein YgfZ